MPYKGMLKPPVLHVVFILQIKDAYSKIVIARTKYDLTQYEGVQIYDIARWLTENK